MGTRPHCHTHRISYSPFSSSIYQTPDGLPTRPVKHVSLQLSSVALSTPSPRDGIGVTRARPLEDGSMEKGRDGDGQNRSEKAPAPRGSAAAPPDTEAAMGGKWGQRLQPAFGGGAEREERRGPLHTPKWRCLTGENWIHPSELEFGGRATSQRARESRNPRERRMRLTGTDEKREGCFSSALWRQRRQ